MDRCDKVALLKSLRRRHQIVCSVIAILLISIGVAGVTARLGLLLMSRCLSLPFVFWSMRSCLK